MVTSWNLLCVVVVLPAVPLPENPPASLAEVVERMQQAPLYTNLDELIKAGLQFLASQAQSSVADDLAFLKVAAAYHSRGNDFANQMGKVLDPLKNKHRKDPYALFRILLMEGDMFRDAGGDRKRERAAYEQALKLEEGMRVQMALDQLRLHLKLGENYIGVVDPRTGREDKAREMFQKIIEFEFPARPTANGWEEYADLYTKAALRLVVMSTDAERRRLRFHPFALGRIHELYPDLAKQLAPGSPEVAKFLAMVERWAQSTLKDLPKDSPMRPHFEAVLQHLRKDRPD
jgi:hypothetical protein